MAGPMKKAGRPTSKAPSKGPKSVASKPGGPSFGSRQGVNIHGGVAKKSAAPAPKATRAVPVRQAAGSSASSAQAAKAKAAAAARQSGLNSRISIPKGERITPIGSPTMATRIAPVTRVAPAKSTAPRIAPAPRKGYSIPKQR